VRCYPVQALLLCAVAVVPVACRKPQVAASASPVPMSAKGAAVAPAAPIVNNATRFTGELKRGQKFQKAIAPNMIFALEPYAGNDSGWTIRLVPGADSKSISMDCIGAVSEPLHGDKNLEIEPPDGLSQEPVRWKPREFEFVPDSANCKAAWELMNLVYYPSKLTDEQRAEAAEKLGKIPTAHGKFTVVNSLLRPAGNPNDTGSIEWLKFEVELNFPAPSSPTPLQDGATQKQTAAAGGIHAVDLENFLKTNYLQAQPELTYLKDECATDQPPIMEVGVQYGDLDADGQDEAIYQGFTCMSGTAGVDYFGALKLSPDGKIIPLPIEGQRNQFKGRHDLYQGLRGHLRLEIQNGRLVEIFPVYATERECNACSSGGERKFVYRWDGHQFTLDDIIDTPEESAKKSGS
jgi:hypothetical protein